MFPVLEYLARAYFHQDYDVDFGEPDEVLIGFQSLESRENILAMLADVRKVLDSGMSELEIGELWSGTWRSSYTPSREGRTYRQWLEHILQVVVAI